MDTLLRTLVFVSLLVPASQALGQYHKLIGGTSLTYIQEAGSSVELDGSQTIGLRENGLLKVVRLDPDGVPVWQREVFSGRTQTPNVNKYSRIEADVYDGICFFGFDPLSYIVQNSLTGWTDSLIHRFEFGTLDPDGLLSEVVGIERSLVSLWNSADLRGSVSRLGSDGSLFLLVEFDGLDLYHPGVELIHVTPSNTISWARSIGSLSAVAGIATVDPFSFPSNRWDFHIGSDGSSVLVRASENSPSLIIVKLDSAGDLLWAKEFAYTNGANNSNSPGSAVDANGRIHVCLEIDQLASSYRSLLLTVGPDGELEAAHTYTESISGPIHVTDAGDLMITKLDAFLSVDPDGNAIAAYHTPNQVQDPDTYLGNWRTTAALGNSLYWHGDFMQVNGISGVQSRWAAALKVDPMDPDDCVWQQRAPVEQYDAFDLIQITPLTDLLGVDITSTYTTYTPSPIVISDGITPEAQELCALVTGTAELGKPRPFDLVTYNSIASGAAIPITDGPHQRLQVFDMIGKSVFDQQGAHQRSIQTQGWPSGFYVVRGLDSDGALIGVERIVIH